MIITLNETQISDLFFNIEKPVLSEVYSQANEADKELDDVLIDDALMSEAKTFF